MRTDRKTKQVIVSLNKIYCSIFPKLNHLGGVELGIKISYASVWISMKNENYFTIQFIFATIHGFHCTF